VIIPYKILLFCGGTFCITAFAGKLVTFTLIVATFATIQTKQSACQLYFSR
jgi:hypothetical protein